MAEIKINDLPVILGSDFTDNDRFLIIDGGRARLMSKPVLQAWIEDNLQGSRGLQGLAGRDGKDGKNGKDGADGAAGLSAYQVAISNGFVGSPSEWLNSFSGARGSRGADGDLGWSPLYNVESRGDDSVLRLVDWIGGTGTKPLTLGYMSDFGIVSEKSSATNVRGLKGDRGAVGEKGDKGDDGGVGAIGAQGLRGESAYELAVKKGFGGTESEWILSLNSSAISLTPDNTLEKKIDGLYSPEVSASVIKTRYESNSNTNPFTDANLQTLDDLTLGKIKNQNGSQSLMFWTGTQAEFNAISPKDANTMYFVV